MTKNFILICYVIVTLTACQTKNEAGDERAHTNYDSTLTAVIPWDFNYPFDSLTCRPTTLSHSDIEQIEDLLVATVIDYNNSLSSGHEDYKIDLETKGHKKQLVAVVNSKGEKEVWVNCFCDIEGDSWRSGIIMVSDGGPCFFNFKINLTTKEVYELVVNGFA
ncbi:MAG TPA: hypothetical protein VK589_26460 [Chryseolinea sp.]|nr:hypothetical protein [Chryseolinea sp.]